MILRSFTIVAILATPTNLFAQPGPAVPKDSSAVVAEELEAIITEAEKLDNKNAVVNIKSRAAMLVSFSDPVRSESMFRAAWKFTTEQTDEGFDKEQAKLTILKYLFTRHPKLARQLIAEQPKPKDSASESNTAGGDEESGLAARFASEMVNMDPSAAAGLLERSLSIAATPGMLSALSRLRERDSLLSDYVALKAVEALTMQRTKVSLPGLFYLGAYIFPGTEAPVPSMEAEFSLQSLQYRYFLAGSDVLRASLNETTQALVKEQHYSERDLQMRSAFQAQVAAVLAALAPRFQPSSATELTAIAGKLAPQMPPNMPQLSQVTLGRISGNPPTSKDPDTNFMLALSNGDFDEARKLLESIKGDEKKDLYAQLLLKIEARALLAKADVMGALTAIRKLQDQTNRLVMYLDALKATMKKRDSDLTKIVINEARLLVPQTERNGIHLRALLSFTTLLKGPETKDEAMEFLNSAVVTINSLGKKSSEKGPAETMAEAAMQELNNPMNLFDAPEMEQGFSSLGLADLEATLAVANRIEVKPLRLLARLEAIQGIIKRLSQKPKLAPRGPNVSSQSIQ